MKFSSKCRTQKLRMKYTIFGSFSSFLNWERANIRPQNRPRKIPVDIFCGLYLFNYKILGSEYHIQLNKHIWASWRENLSSGCLT